MARRFARIHPVGWLLVLTVSSAFAQSSGTRAVSATVGATSDFVFRGLSYTRGKPAGLASFDVEFPSRTYFGGFVSSADPNPGPSPAVEMDFWLGHHWSLDNVLSADVRLTHYMYPDDPRVADYDRDELTATFGVRDVVFFSATYCPNMDAIGSTAGFTDGDVWAVELSARRPFGGRYSIGAGIGYYSLDDVYDYGYAYWNVTLVADFAPFQLQLAALGADSAAERLFGSRSAGERLALTALYRFATTR